MAETTNAILYGWRFSVMADFRVSDRLVQVPGTMASEEISDAATSRLLGMRARERSMPGKYMGAGDAGLAPGPKSQSGAIGGHFDTEQTSYANFAFHTGSQNNLVVLSNTVLGQHQPCFA